MKVVKNAVITNTPPPTRGLQALNVAAERIGLERVKGALNVDLFMPRKFSEQFSCAFRYEQSPGHGEVDRASSTRRV